MNDWLVRDILAAKNMETPLSPDAEVWKESAEKSLVLYAGARAEIRELKDWIGRALECLNTGVDLMTTAQMDAWDGVRKVIESCPVKGVSQ